MATFRSRKEGMIAPDLLRLWILSSRETAQKSGLSPAWNQRCIGASKGQGRFRLGHRLASTVACTLRLGPRALLFLLWCHGKVSHQTKWGISAPHLGPTADPSETTPACGSNPKSTSANQWLYQHTGAYDNQSMDANPTMNWRWPRPWTPSSATVIINHNEQPNLVGYCMLLPLLRPWLLVINGYHSTIKPRVLFVIHLGGLVAFTDRAKACRLLHL